MVNIENPDHGGGDDGFIEAQPGRRVFQIARANIVVPHNDNSNPDGVVAVADMPSCVLPPLSRFSFPPLPALL